MISFYDDYKNRIEKIARVKNVMHKFRFLIIALLLLIIGGISALLAMKGTATSDMKFFVDNTEISAQSVECFYGTPYNVEPASAFMSSGYVEYAKEGSEDWSETKPTRPGTYKVRTVTSKVAGSGYFESDQKLIIKPLPVTLAVTGTSVTYGNAPACAFEEPLPSGMYLDDSCVAITLADYSASTTTVSIVGDSVKILGTVDDGFGLDYSDCFDVTLKSAEITILKRAITVTPVDATFTYGGTDVPYEKVLVQATQDQLAEGDRVVFDVEYKIGSTVLAAVNAGNYTVNVKTDAFKIMRGSVDVTSQYNPTFRTGALKIERKALTVNSASASKTYDAVALDEALYKKCADTPGLISGHKIIIDSVYSNVKNVSDSKQNVLLSYRIVAEDDASETDLKRNYDITEVWGTLTISKKSVTITSGQFSKVYDGLAMERSDYLSCEAAGLVASHEVQVLDGPSNIVNVADSTDNSLTYIIYSATDGNVSANYDVTEVWQKLTVTKRPVTFKTGSIVEIYNSTPISQPVPESVDGLAAGHNYEVDGQATYCVDFTPTPVPNATRYVIKDAHGADVSVNYEIAYNSDCGTITVKARPLTVVTPSDSFVYDGMTHPQRYELRDPEVYYVDEGGARLQGLFNGDELQLVSATEVKYVRDTAANNNVCVYRVPAGNLNYVILDSEYEYGTLTVTKRPISQIRLLDKNVVYGDYDFTNPDHLAEIYEIEQGNYVQDMGSAPNLAITDNIIIKSVAYYNSQTNLSLRNPCTPEDVHNYYIMQTDFAVVDMSDDSDVTENYEITSFDWKAGTLSITKRPIYVETADLDWEYDGTRHSAYEFVDGLVKGSAEYLEGMTHTYTAFYADGDEVSGWRKNTSKPGLLGGVILSFNENSNLPASIVDVGTEDNVCEFDALTNYDIKYVKPGTLSVTPRKIMVATATVSKVYDGKNLEATAPEVKHAKSEGGVYVEDAGAEGLVINCLSGNLDELTVLTSTVVCNVCAAVENDCTYASPVGVFGNANYEIVAPIDKGTLTVTARNIFVEIDDKSCVYGEEAPINSYKIYEFRTPLGEYAEDDGAGINDKVEVNLPDGETLVLEYGYEPDSVGAARTYAIKMVSHSITGENEAGPALIDNYSIDYTDGVLVISKKILTVEVDDEQFVYGGAEAPEADELTYTIKSGSDVLENIPDNDAAAPDTFEIVSVAYYMESGGVETRVLNPTQAGITYTIRVTSVSINGEVANLDDGKFSFENYEITVEDATLTIKARKITVTLYDDLSCVYGNSYEYDLTADGNYKKVEGHADNGDDLALAAGETLRVTAVNYYAQSDTAHSSPLSPLPVNAGSYLIWANASDLEFKRGSDDVAASNYEIVEIVDGRLTIKARKITVEMNSHLTVRYGDAFSYDTDSENNAIITGDDAYNGGAATLVYGESLRVGNVIYYEKNADGTRGDEIVGTPVAAGEYLIAADKTAIYIKADGAAAGELVDVDDCNYQITFVDGTLKISQRGLTVTLPELTAANGNKNLIYGVEVPKYVTYTHDDIAELKEGETLVVYVKYVKGVEYAASAVRSVGTYEMVGTGKYLIVETGSAIPDEGGDAVLDNYTVDAVNPGALQITEKEIIIYVDDFECRYGQFNTGNHKYAIEVGNHKGDALAPATEYGELVKITEVRYLPLPVQMVRDDGYDIYISGTVESTETVGSGSDAYSVYTLSSSDAAVEFYESDGTTPVENGADNYVIRFVTGKLTIKKAPVSIAIKDRTHKYGENISKVAEDYELLKVDGNVFNGKLEYEETLTVTAIYFTQAGVEVADPIDKGEYDIIPKNCTVKYSEEGVIKTDSAEFTRVDDTTYRCELKNYVITCKIGKLTIEAKPISIKVKLDSQTFTYGDAKPVISTEIYEYVGGVKTLVTDLPHGDVADFFFTYLASNGVDEAVFRTASGETVIDAGDYFVRLLWDDSRTTIGGKAANFNYELVEADSTLTVDFKYNPKSIKITLLDFNFYYGEFGTGSNVYPSGAVDNFDISGSLAPETAFGEKIQVSVVYYPAAVKLVGDYKILINGERTATAVDGEYKVKGGFNVYATEDLSSLVAGGADNYELTFVEGTLTVSKKPIIVSIEDYTKTYGDDAVEPEDIALNITHIVGGSPVAYTLPYGESMRLTGVEYTLHTGGILGRTFTEFPNQAGYYDVTATGYEILDASGNKIEDSKLGYEISGSISGVFILKRKIVTIYISSFECDYGEFGTDGHTYSAAVGNYDDTNPETAFGELLKIDVRYEPTPVREVRTGSDYYSIKLDYRSTVPYEGETYLLGGVTVYKADGTTRIVDGEDNYYFKAVDGKLRINKRELTMHVVGSTAPYGTVLPDADSDGAPDVSFTLTDKNGIEVPVNDLPIAGTYGERFSATFKYYTNSACTVAATLPIRDAGTYYIKVESYSVTHAVVGDTTANYQINKGETATLVITPLPLRLLMSDVDEEIVYGEDVCEGDYVESRRFPLPYGEKIYVGFKYFKNGSPVTVFNASTEPYQIAIDYVEILRDGQSLGEGEKVYASAYEPDEQLVARNYTCDFDDYGSLTVNKKDITGITLPELLGSDAYVYGAALPAYFDFTSELGVTGETLRIYVDYDGAAPDTVKDVGTYVLAAAKFTVIKGGVEYDGDLAAFVLTNYTVDPPRSGKLQIVEKEITVTLKSGVSVEYGDDYESVILQGAGPVGLEYGEIVESLKLVYTPANPKNASATPYTAEVDWANSTLKDGRPVTNYKLSAASVKEVTFTIVPKQIKISVGICTTAITYGDTAPDLTSGDDVFVTVADKNGSALSLTALPGGDSLTVTLRYLDASDNVVATPENVGIYRVDAVVTFSAGALSTNYNVSYFNSNASGAAGLPELTIGKLTVNVTVADMNVYYGDALPTEFNPVQDPETLPNGETLNLTFSFDYRSKDSAKLPCGDYPVEMTFTGVTGGNASKDNYNVMPTLGKLHVNKKSVIVKAVDQSCAYGETLPENSVELFETVEGVKVALAALPYGETLVVPFYAYSYAPVATPTETGDYDIVVNLASASVTGGNASLNNYDFTVEKGTLTIGVRRVSVVLNDGGATSFVYGDDFYASINTATKTTTVSDSAIAGGATKTVNLTVALKYYSDAALTTQISKPTAARTEAYYAVLDWENCKVNSIPASNNYILDHDEPSMSFTIGKRNLSVKVNAATAVYGDAPEFTFTYDDGFLPGNKLPYDESLTVEYDYDAATQKNVANYSIGIKSATIAGETATASGGTVSFANYVLSYTAGTFEITRRPVIIETLGDEWTYDGLKHEVATIVVHYAKLEGGVWTPDASKDGLVYTDNCVKAASATLPYVVNVFEGEVTNGYEYVIDTANYQICAEKFGKLKVNPAPLSAEITGTVSVEYGGVYSHEINVTSATANGESVTLAFAYYKGATKLVPPAMPDVAGTYTVKLDTDASIVKKGLMTIVRGIENYDISCADFTFNITAREITVKLEDMECFYGEFGTAGHTYPNTVGNYKGGADAPDTYGGQKLLLSIAYNPTSPKDAGIYAININGAVSVDGGVKTVRGGVKVYASDGITLLDGCEENYIIHFESGVLNIKKREISSVSLPTDVTYTYGDTVKYRVELDGVLIGEEKLVVYVDYEDGPSTPAKDVGTYTMVPVSYAVNFEGTEYVSAEGGLTLTNYVINTCNQGSIKIEKKSVTVTVKNINSIYGDSYSYAIEDRNYSRVTPSLVSGETLKITAVNYYASAADATADTSNVNGITPVNAGSYAIKAISWTVIGGSASNYDFTWNYGTLTIAARTVNVKIENISKTYGDTDVPARGSALSDNGGNAALGGYSVTSGSFVSGDVLTLTIKYSDFTGSEIAGTPSNAGNYTVGVLGATLTGAGSGTVEGNKVTFANYVINVTSGTLAIARRSITVHLPAVAAEDYSGTEHTYAGAWTLTSGSFKAGETLTPAYGYYTDAACTAPVGGKPRNAGTYYVMLDADASTIGASAANVNYNITCDPVEFTVNRVKVTITVSIDGSGSYVYGNVNVAADVRVVSVGTVHGESLSVTPVFKQAGATIATPVDVGTYTAEVEWASCVVGAISASVNYELDETASTMAASFEITRKSIVLTVDDKSAVFGDAVALTYTLTDGAGATISRLPNSDSINVGYNYDPETQNSVNTYTVNFITVNITGENKTISGNPTLFKNYSVTTVGGSVTITARPILLESPSSNEVFDGNKHTAGTISVSFAVFNPSTGNWVKNASKPGLVNGDTCTVTTPAASLPYALNVGDSVTNALGYSVTNAANYDVHVAWGTLTVSPCEIRIKTGSASRTYNGLPLSNSDYTVLNGVTLAAGYSLVPDGPTFSIVNVTGAGGVNNDVRLKISGPVPENYRLVTSEYGTLKITPAPLSMVISESDGKTSIKFGESFTHTIALTGTPVNGEKVYPVLAYYNGATKLSSKPAEVGTYTVKLDEAATTVRMADDVTVIANGLNNYEVSVNVLTIEITPIEVTGTLAVKVGGVEQYHITYGDGAPTIVATFIDRNGIDVTSQITPKFKVVKYGTEEEVAFGNAGKYTITLVWEECMAGAQLAQGNFILQNVVAPVVFEIDKLDVNIEITVDNTTVLYGDEPGFTPAIKDGGGAALTLPYGQTLSLTYGWTKTPGTSSVTLATASISGNDGVISGSSIAFDNYNATYSFSASSITVSRRPIIIVTESKQWIYDGTAKSHPVFSVHFAVYDVVEGKYVADASKVGLVYGDACVAAATGHATITDVGSMPNTVAYELSNGAYYNIYNEYGTLTVEQLEIKIETGDLFDKVYTGTEYTCADYTIVNGIVPVNATIVPDVLFGYTNATGVGGVNNTTTFKLTGSAAGNYKLTVVRYGRFYIAPAPLTVEIYEESGLGDVDYGTALSYKARVKSGSSLVNGETAEFALTFMREGSVVSDPADAGHYVVSLSAGRTVIKTAGGDVITGGANNYDITCDSVSFEIRRVKIKVTLSVEGGLTSVEYCDVSALPGVIVEYSDLDGNAISGTVNMVVRSYVGGELRSLRDVGDYVIKFDGDASVIDGKRLTVNYEVVEAQSTTEIAFSITKKTVNLSIDDVSAYYGDSISIDFSMTDARGDEITRLPNGDSMTLVTDYNAEECKTVGSHSLAITKVTIAGREVSVAGGTADFDNYEVHVTGGTVTVNVRPVFIETNSFTADYDGEAHESDGVIKVFYAEYNGTDWVKSTRKPGLVYGDTCEAIVDALHPLPSRTDVGETANDLYFELDASKYDVKGSKIGTIKINRISLRLNVAALPEVEYGEAVPALGTITYESGVTTLFTVTGNLFDSDTLVCTLNYRNGTPSKVGYYTVEVSDLTINGQAATVSGSTYVFTNYSVTVNGSQLHVKEAELTAEIYEGPSTVTYGESYTHRARAVSGLKNGERVEFALIYYSGASSVAGVPTSAGVYSVRINKNASKVYASDGVTLIENGINNYKLTYDYFEPFEILKKDIAVKVELDKAPEGGEYNYKYGEEIKLKVLDAATDAELNAAYFGAGSCRFSFEYYDEDGTLMGTSAKLNANDKKYYATLDWDGTKIGGVSASTNYNLTASSVLSTPRFKVNKLVSTIKISDKTIVYGTAFSFDELRTDYAASNVDYLPAGVRLVPAYEVVGVGDSFTLLDANPSGYAVTIKTLSVASPAETGELKTDATGKYFEFTNFLVYIEDAVLIVNKRTVKVTVSMYVAEREESDLAAGVTFSEAYLLTQEYSSGMPTGRVGVLADDMPDPMFIYGASYDLPTAYGIYEVTFNAFAGFINLDNYEFTADSEFTNYFVVCEKAFKVITTVNATYTYGDEVNPDYTVEYLYRPGVQATELDSCTFEFKYLDSDKNEIAKSAITSGTYYVYATPTGGYDPVRWFVNTPPTAFVIKRLDATLTLTNNTLKSEYSYEELLDSANKAEFISRFNDISFDIVPDIGSDADAIRTALMYNGLPLAVNASTVFNVGTYTVTFTGYDADKYNLEGATFSFEVTPVYYVLTPYMSGSTEFIYNQNDVSTHEISLPADAFKMAKINDDGSVTRDVGANALGGETVTVTGNALRYPTLRENITVTGVKLNGVDYEGGNYVFYTDYDFSSEIFSANFSTREFFVRFSYAKREITYFVNLPAGAEREKVYDAAVWTYSLDGVTHNLDETPLFTGHKYVFPTGTAEIGTKVGTYTDWFIKNVKVVDATDESIDVKNFYTFTCSNSDASKLTITKRTINVTINDNLFNALSAASGAADHGVSAVTYINDQISQRIVEQSSGYYSPSAYAVYETVDLLVYVVYDSLRGAYAFTCTPCTYLEGTTLLVDASKNYDVELDFGSNGPALYDGTISLSELRAIKKQVIVKMTGALPADMSGLESFAPNCYVLTSGPFTVDRANMDEGHQFAFFAYVGTDGNRHWAYTVYEDYGSGLLADVGSKYEIVITNAASQDEGNMEKLTITQIKKTANWVEVVSAPTFEVETRIEGGMEIATYYVVIGGTRTEVTPDANGRVALSSSLLDLRYPAGVTPPEEVIFYLQIDKQEIPEYTVTVNLMGHGDNYVVTTEEFMLAEPTEPVASGYHFHGWYTDASCTTLFDFSSPLTDDCTIYAKWVKYYNVTVNYQGLGGTDYTQEVETTMSAPAVETVDDYTFLGWYYDEECTSRVTFPLTVTSDCTIYAGWKAYYKAYFYLDNEAVMAWQTVSTPDYLTKPTPDPTYGGYRFDGWFNVDESTMAYTTAFDFSVPLTGDVNIYGKWSRYYICDVRYNEMGGTDYREEVFAPFIMTAPTVSTVAGYDFGGWYADSSLTTEFNFSAAIPEICTIYAKWTPYYMLTLDFGGFDVDDSIKVEGPDYVVNDQPAIAAHEGHASDGWYYDPACTLPVTFPLTVSADITIYAGWVGVYKVFFYADASEEPIYVVNTTGTVTRPATDPDRADAFFDGWYEWDAIDGYDDEAFDFTTTISGNLSLYAKWSPAYVVSFYKDHGDAILYAIDTSKGLVARPVTDPDKADGFFDGWYEWIEGVGYSDEAFDFDSTISGNLNLYAKWKPAYEVNFYANYGDFATYLTVTSKGTVEKPAPPAAVSGRVFRGWYNADASGNLTTPFDFTAEIDGNVNIYGKWSTFSDVPYVYTDIRSDMTAELYEDGGNLFYSVKGGDIVIDGGEYKLNLKVFMPTERISIDDVMSLCYFDNADPSTTFGIDYSTSPEEDRRRYVLLTLTFDLEHDPDVVSHSWTFEWKKDGAFNQVITVNVDMNGVTFKDEFGNVVDRDPPAMFALPMMMAAPAPVAAPARMAAPAPRRVVKYTYTGTFKIVFVNSEEIIPGMTTTRDVTGSYQIVSARADIQPGSLREAP